MLPNPVSSVGSPSLRALKANPLWPPPFSFHQPPPREATCLSLTSQPPRKGALGPGGGGEGRSHRDIPSDGRQLSLFRCPRVSPQLSASHGPSTSSSQQLLKPEKRRKWKPGVSRMSVRATG